MYQQYIDYHKEPIFRNNYDIGIIGNNYGHFRFNYCNNNKRWLGFLDGFEIGFCERLVSQLKELYPNIKL